MCDSSGMKTRLWLGLVCILVLTIPANAAEWVLQRFEGREYVSLDNIAAFYGLPKPPAVELTGHVLSTPANPLVTAKSDEPSPISGVEPPSAVAASKTITLD